MQSKTLICKRKPADRILGDDCYRNDLFSVTADKFLFSAGILTGGVYTREPCPKENLPSGPI
jgi:hypothetical protein